MTYATSGAPQVLTFGNMVDYCDHVHTDPITEEVMTFLIMVDQNDIEGFGLKDYKQFIDNEVSVCTALYATPA